MPSCRRHRVICKRIDCNKCTRCLTTAGGCEHVSKDAEKADAITDKRTVNTRSSSMLVSSSSCRFHRKKKCDQCGKCPLCDVIDGGCKHAIAMPETVGHRQMSNRNSTKITSNLNEEQLLVSQTGYEGKE